MRTPIKRRRRRIIQTAAADNSTEGDDSKESSTAKILHVEDDQTVAGMVKEMLENQGWQVETCDDGNAALEKISGEDDYDLGADVFLQPQGISSLVETISHLLHERE